MLKMLALIALYWVVFYLFLMAGKEVEDRIRERRAKKLRARPEFQCCEREPLSSEEFWESGKPPPPYQSDDESSDEELE
jgi:hypothetical protein